MYVQLTEKTSLEVPTDDRNERLLRTNFGYKKEQFGYEELKRTCLDSMEVILRVPREIIKKNPENYYKIIDRIFEEKGPNYLLAAIYKAQFDLINWEHPDEGIKYSLYNWDYLNEDLSDIRKYQYEDKEVDAMRKVMEAHRKSKHF